MRKRPPPYPGESHRFWVTGQPGLGALRSWPAAGITIVYLHFEFRHATYITATLRSYKATAFNLMHFCECGGFR